MRAIVRYVLMAASLGGLLFVAYIIVVHDDITSEGWFLVTSMGVGLTINFVYLLTDLNKRTPSRIKKLFGLWLDAKEHELRKRAGNDALAGQARPQCDDADDGGSGVRNANQQGEGMTNRSTFLQQFGLWYAARAARLVMATIVAFAWIMLVTFIGWLFDLEQQTLMILTIAIPVFAMFACGLYWFGRIVVWSGWIVIYSIRVKLGQKPRRLPWEE